MVTRVLSLILDLQSKVEVERRYGYGGREILIVSHTSNSRMTGTDEWKFHTARRFPLHLSWSFDSGCQ